MGAYYHTPITVFPSQARTTSVTSADFENFYARGVKVVIDVTAFTGTPSLTVKIQGKDTVSGKYYDILSSGAISTIGTTVLTVYPGLSATPNVTANDVLPRFWRVTVTAGTTDSVTYSVGACTLR